MFHNQKIKHRHLQRELGHSVPFLNPDSSPHSERAGPSLHGVQEQPDDGPEESPVQPAYPSTYYRASRYFTDSPASSPRQTAATPGPPGTTAWRQNSAKLTYESAPESLTRKQTQAPIPEITSAAHDGLYSDGASSFRRSLLRDLQVSSEHGRLSPGVGKSSSQALFTRLSGGQSSTPSPSFVRGHLPPEFLNGLTPQSVPAPPSQSPHKSFLQAPTQPSYQASLPYLPLDPSVNSFEASQAYQGNDDQVSVQGKHPETRQLSGQDAPRPIQFSRTITGDYGLYSQLGKSSPSSRNHFVPISRRIYSPNACRGANKASSHPYHRPSSQLSSRLTHMPPDQPLVAPCPPRTPLYMSSSEDVSEHSASQDFSKSPLNLEDSHDDGNAAGYGQESESTLDVESFHPEATTVTSPSTACTSRGTRYTPFSTTTEASQVICALSEARGVTPSVGAAFFNVSTSEVILTHISDSQFYSKTIHKLHVLEPSRILLLDSAGSVNPKSHLRHMIEENVPYARIIFFDRKHWSESAGEQYLDTLAPREDAETIKVATRGNFYTTCAFAAVRVRA